MKNIYTFFFCAIFLLMNSTNHSQTIDSPYEVGTWQGFRTAAVTFTFDDNCSNQIAIALPMFDEYNFKMTFYPVINWSPNWNALKTAVANGHEVGSHTITHPHLGNLDSANQNIELKNSRDQINAHMANNKCISVAYPYCETGNIEISKQYYIAGRICSGSIVSKNPSDFMRISSIICGTEGSVKTPQDFKNRYNSAASLKGWVVFLIHGIDNDGGYSPVESENLRGALDTLNAHRDKFWEATFVNVVCYIKERNSVSVEELSFEDSTITLSVTDTLDNSIFSYPITLRRILPDGWNSATISQNGNQVQAEIIEIDSQKYVMFDIVPDEGNVTIVGSSITGVSNESNLLPSNPRLMQNYPNPFNPITTITYELPAENEIELSIFNLLGQKIKTLVSKQQPAGEYKVSWDASNHTSGVYFYQLKTNEGFIQTEKLVLLK